MKHSKYNHIKQIVETNIPVLLEGEAGVGKTTIAKQLASDLNLKFSTTALTKQTSMNALLGFISVNGDYVPSQFRRAIEEGHLFLLDEINAADANTLLCMNSLENGYIAFPDEVIQVHHNFRLIAAGNPNEEGALYTGRSKLDFSTEDRFHTIHLDRDPELEAELTSLEIAAEANILRNFLKSQGSTIQVTMRATTIAHRLRNIDQDSLLNTVFCKPKHEELKTKFLSERKEQLAKHTEELAELKKQEGYNAKTQHEVDTLDELWQKIQAGK